MVSGLHNAARMSSSKPTTEYGTISSSARTQRSATPTRPLSVRRNRM